MAYCKNCGAQMADHLHYCTACGAPMGELPAEPVNTAREHDFTSNFDTRDIEDNKWLAIFSYFGLVPMIFAMIAKPNSRFIRFHINQGLNLFLLGLVSAVVGLIPFLGWVAAGVAGIFSVVCIILGIINCVNGKAKELPVIGKIRIVR